MSLGNHNLLNLSQDMLEKAVVQTFVQESILFDKASIINITGNAYSYNRVNEGFTVEKRELGEDVFNINQLVTTKITEPLGIYTVRAKVDRVAQLTTETDLMALEMEMMSKSMSHEMQGELLTKLKTDAEIKLTGGMTIDTILDAMDGMTYTPEDTVIFANAKTSRALTRQAHESGYLTGHIEAVGRNIPTINNVALQSVKCLEDGEALIVYFNAVDGVCLASNGGVKIYNSQSGVFQITDAELLACPVVKNTKAVALVTETTPINKKKK